MDQRNFWGKLQSADEAKKGRWMLVSTAVIGVIVIYIWLAYFNTLIGSVGGPQAVPQDAGGAFTFWQTMKNGAAIIYDSLGDELHALEKILSTPREYVIEPPIN